METARLLTVEQVAKQCQVSLRTVYRAISRGSLRASHLGGAGAYRVRPEDVEAWLEASAVRAGHSDARIRTAPRRPAPGPPPGSLVVPERMDARE